MDPHFSSAKQLPTYCTAEPLVRTAHNATSSFRTSDRFCWAISVASPHKSIFGFSNSTELCWLIDLLDHFQNKLFKDTTPVLPASLSARKASEACRTAKPSLATAARTMLRSACKTRSKKWKKLCENCQNTFLFDVSHKVPLKKKQTAFLRSHSNYLHSS